MKLIPILVTRQPVAQFIKSRVLLKLGAMGLLGLVSSGCATTSNSSTAKNQVLPFRTVTSYESAHDPYRSD